MSYQPPGTLYVVATPIGNLEDLTPRAARILESVSRIAAEDTRHSARLLSHLGISKPLLSLHEHNEAHRVDTLDAYLEAGESIALISDAGTPLISDPGFILVRALRSRNRHIVPIPGVCALTAALSGAGLPTDRFIFAGFLPAKAGARRQVLENYQKREETLVFYESPHRIAATLEALAEQMPERPIVLARELTKTFETFLQGVASELLDILAADPNQARGEFVVMIGGAPAAREVREQSIDDETLLKTLLDEGVGVKQGAAIAANLLGGRKKEWYARLQMMKPDS
ncbi:MULTISPECIES: 16S rRNA (cytidine(1402)-2'-O)-methyltransferase [unclassified Halomonas]|uniref:16S rRNA (cytidine(1402)-2'-O)-methyltransferase n=1 Tax=unclassified Halomonas TaxID=2609666 RepID=UPI0021E4B97D|nr:MULTISPECIES: 16S rRNA (cytidine(1402)-2'-O)-methyltransferase [unclassified Halomonas]UYF98532.1 16S rRNA (cytidine(1402)-2'-O)-methyltransferase [Halomonas sp. GD1P12]WNL40355.1 16S rRNA (cytidine(1402)-2'-O)-methyltransferase [Halomonas sp. PAMB 3232]